MPLKIELVTESVTRDSADAEVKIGSSLPVLEASRVLYQNEPIIILINAESDHRTRNSVVLLPGDVI